MDDLKLQLHKIARRMSNFSVIADTFVETGFCNPTIHGLKPKHVRTLVDYWKNGYFKEVPNHA